VNAPIRLTSLAHGGGCGCKLAPAVLEQLLAQTRASDAFPNLLVGTETGDDAAVYRLVGDTCVIATTDFFTPIVDDAKDFGRIAATNAISDVYAMGGRPVFALAILGMPLGKLEPAVVREILAGGAEVCARAGIPVAGGHSIDAPEPIYGLAVIGTCAAHEVKRNSGAQPGDALILTKALGVGVYSAAIKKDSLGADGYAEMLATTTLLNEIGTELARDAAVHAMTDVTGFGLLGHGLEMARGSGVTLTLWADEAPLLKRAAELAQQGFVTGASGRNWASYGASVDLPAGLADWRRHLLTDPQTSGGLLVAVEAAHAQRVLGTIRGAGYSAARIVGRADAGTPSIRIVELTGSADAASA
jgi:selenide,water dikinase